MTTLQIICDAGLLEYGTPDPDRFVFGMGWCVIRGSHVYPFRKARTSLTKKSHHSDLIEFYGIINAVVDTVRVFGENHKIHLFTDNETAISCFRHDKKFFKKFLPNQFSHTGLTKEKVLEFAKYAKLTSIRHSRSNNSMIRHLHKIAHRLASFAMCDETSGCLYTDEDFSKKYFGHIESIRTLIDTFNATYDDFRIF